MSYGNDEPRPFSRESADFIPMPTPMSMGEVEQRLQRADDELATLTETHVRFADEAARAEARWKNHRDRVIVLIANSGDRGAKDTREALSKQRRCGSEQCPCAQDHWAGEELYRESEIRHAAVDSSARAMRAIEARLSAFQTIASNLRSVIRT